MPQKLLGETLIARGKLTKSQVDRAIQLQIRCGSRLGDVLIGEGMLGYRPLYEAIAEQKKLPFIDLVKSPPDGTLLSEEDSGFYLRHGVMPWRRNDGILCIAVTDISEALLDMLQKKYGRNIHVAVTSAFDIRRTVEHYFGDVIETECRLQLWKRNQLVSARETMPPHHKKWLLFASAFLLMAIWLAPIHSALTMIIICHAAYAATMLFKFVIFIAGMPAGNDAPIQAAHIDEKDLPVYTILIPMYKEAASLPGMLEAMKNLDYPSSKLDIKLVLEADDHETLDAAHALKPGYRFDIIRVPPSEPRTKPKACNYALRFAKGEYVTIFDADDRPERTQLKKAVQAFRSLPSDVACVQARLNYYNANDNLLTRFFSLEYTVLFHFMLYGLERLGMPIPLGGTSNHIALGRLKELGEWDPFNVTEDADLGVRLAGAGFKTRMLDSYTMEEAPNRLRPWIRQRSRWIKGYMQTWLVHMRRPRHLLKVMGWRGFTGFQFFVGLSCFSFLTAPLVWGLSLLWLGQIAGWHQVAFPAWLVTLSMLNLLLNLMTHWYLSIYSSTLYRENRQLMLVAGLLYPLYLLLHSLASYKALWQLFVKPHFWEKTTHGLALQIDLPGTEGKILKTSHK